MATPMSIVAVILLVFCAALAWRQQRRLLAMQARLESLSRDVRRLEGAHESLLVRLINKQRLRKARRASGLSSALEEKVTPPIQSDEKNVKGSALYVVAPKTSPE
jgi:hypothetical protein